MLSDWIPRRQFRDEDDIACSPHRKAWQSANEKVFFSFRSDVYLLHIHIGKLSLSWDAPEL